MNYYYIDFENVKTAGLKGIDQLPSGDTVKIFAKGGSDQMKFNDIKTLMAAKATVTIEDVVTGTKNALDFQLLADLTIDCMKRAGMSPAPRFVIVSADRGYDPAITQMKKRGINNVFRSVSIKETKGENDEQAKPAAKPAGRTRRNNRTKTQSPASDAKTEQKPAPKQEEKTVSENPKAKPKPRRVHTRSINKGGKVNTDSAKN